MDPLNEEQIGKLLRLKKYEMPPPAYFDNFLHEFHRRQRDELLREPVWRIALKRAQDFLFRLNIPGVAVVATTTSLPDAQWSLSNPVTTRALGPSLVRTVKDSSTTHRVAAPPRYVLDSTPVSYEPAFRF